MSTLAQPMMPPGRWHAAKVTAGVLCFVAVVLVVASSFLPLYSGELGFGSQTIEVTITPWHADYGGDSVSASDSPGDVPKVGYPIVFAAVFLACAAAACWYAASPTARQTARRAAGVTTAVSGAFLIGTAWTTALMVSNSVDYVILLGTLNQGLETDATYLVGYWLLLTASLLAFTAAILSLVPARQPSWQAPMPYGPYMPNPSYGMAPPMDALPQPTAQGYPMAQGLTSPAGGTPLAPGAVDPLTGLPVGGLPAGVSFAQGAVVDPVTGQPVSQGPPAGAPFAQSAAVDPMTGQPLVSAETPATGPTPPAPAAADTQGAQPIPAAQPVAFTPEPVGQVNGAPAPNHAPLTEPAPTTDSGLAPSSESVPVTEPAPVAESAPIVVPDAPPLPETPPGPAVPPTEDPLAEPPRT